MYYKVCLACSGIGEGVSTSFVAADRCFGSSRGGCG